MESSEEIGLKRSLCLNNWTAVKRLNPVKQCEAKSHHLLWLYDPFISKRKLARVGGGKKRLKLLVLQKSAN